MSRPDFTHRKNRGPLSDRVSIASGVSHQTIWPRLEEEGFGVLYPQIDINNPATKDLETASMASGISQQTIWPYPGQNSFTARPTMANNPSRTSPEIIDWALVPPALTVNKKRKQPISSAFRTLPQTPSVGGSASSDLAPLSSSSVSNIYSASSRSRYSPTSPVRGQSPIDDSFTRPPRTYYGDRGAPNSPKGRGLEPFPEYEDSGYSAYAQGPYIRPTRPAGPSRKPPPIPRMKTPAPSISGLSAYLDVRYGDDDLGEIRQTKSKWPHRLTPDKIPAHGTDDFVQSFAQMTVVDSDIRGLIQANNEKLNPQESTISVTDPTWGRKHLLNHPPDYPGSTHSTPPTSPEQKKTQEMAGDAAGKRFQSLLNQNKDFQNLMNTLTGIEQWWFENNRQWDSKKRDLETKLEQISEYKEQQRDVRQARPRKRTTKTFVSSYDERIARTDTVDEQDECDSFQEQIDLAEHDILLIKSWLIENSMLTKEVWKQFKVLQGKVEKLQQSTLEAAVPMPSHGFDWIWTDDYASSPLIKEHGLVWWFTQARDHLQKFEAYLGERSKYWKKRMEKCKALEKDYRQRAVENLEKYDEAEDQYDCMVQDLRNILITEPSREAEIDEQTQQILDRRSRDRKRFEEQEHLLNKVLFSFVVEDNANRFRSNDFQDRHWRIEQVLVLVNGMLVAFTIYNYPTNDPDPKNTSRIMKIAYCEAKRQEFTSTLDNLLANEDVMGNAYSSKALLHRAKLHFITQDFHQKAIPLLAATDGAGKKSAHKAFHQLASFWYEEHTSYTILIKSLEKASKETNYGQANITIKDTWKPTPLPPVQDYLPFQLRYSTMPIKDAVDILNRRRTTKSHRMGVKLFRFFNSPDIFPFFWGYTKASWSRPEFVKLLCSLVKYDIPSDAVTAFLTYCDHTGEMFRISGIRSHIRVSPYGWAHGPEAGLCLSFQRRLTHTRPPGSREIEDLMIANSGRFGTDSNQREWRKGDILRVINEVMPHGKLDLQTLDKYCNYWEHAGRMFVTFHGTKRETEPHDSSAYSILLRVDNGWQIPKTAPFIAPDTMPALFDKISHKIESQIDIAPVCLQYEDHDNRIFTTEDKLYNLAYGVREEEHSAECSRSAFHMYLRWCDKERKLFTISREGEVEVKGVMAAGLGGVNKVRRGPDEETLKRQGKNKGSRGGYTHAPFSFGLSRITNWTSGKKR